MDMCSSGTIEVSSGRCERRPRSRCSGLSPRGRTGALINWAVLLALAVGFSVLAGSAALAERRVALIIGNANYDRGGVLWNTINDAKAIAALLSNAGFDIVDQRSNLGVVEFKRAVREFVDRSANADVAVVYYSGHGLEVGGVNYLIPVDAKLMSSFDVDDEAVSLDRLLVATERVKKLSLIILDACRENPFHPVNGEARVTRGGSPGLASVTPTVADTLVAFAAKAGSVSYDGDGPDSPFTTALVKYIAQPGLDIRRALGKVRDEVLRETGNRQEPYFYGSLGGEDVALVPAKSAVPAATAAPPTSVERDEALGELDYRTAERVDSLEGWRAFLAAHPTGSFAQLARAQIEKMPPDGTASASAPERTPYVAGPSNTQPAAGGTGLPASVESAAATPALTPSEVCKRDGDRLARLRGNPSAEEAQHFATELRCEILRPQFLRLMESLGFPAAAPPAPLNLYPLDSSLPGPAMADDCAAQEAALDRLRAEPSEEAARRFWRDLQCERLRPQVRLLMESLNLTPDLPGSSPSAGDEQRHALDTPSTGNGVRGMSATTKDAAADSGACRREAEELDRIRANPDRRQAEQFARTVTCDALKPQAARLLESFTE
jgi:Caspase domain